MKQYDVAIIGAGTAGLSARREVAKATHNYVVIDPGPLGTTCARVGCMPSKVLIQVANDFERRSIMPQIGIHGSEKLSVNSREVMKHVRALRDRFVQSVIQDTDAWTATHWLKARAHFKDQNTLQVGDEVIRAQKIVIATGSSPVIPTTWRELQDLLLTSDEIFELDELPKRVAVIGLGVIGLEIGQALHRLGAKVAAIGLGPAIGGITDPIIQQYVEKAISQEFDLSLEGVERIERKGTSAIVHTRTHSWEVDKIFVAVGRKPNLQQLGLENLAIPFEKNGLPRFDPSTGQIGDLPVFIAGDVQNERPILHEAADEGRIAGYNAVHFPQVETFERRTPLAITFSDPNIAIAGESHKSLSERGADFVIGAVSFEGQGRSIVKLKEKGLLRVYADRRTGLILGAEMMAPDGEHLAHLLSWVIALEQSVDQVLSLPFYHPVVEEGLRTALRDASRQLDKNTSPLEIFRKTYTDARRTSVVNVK